MTLFMPPIQRKKKVDEKYNPDSFRVISEHAVSDHPKFRPLHYRASFEPRTPTPKAPQINNNASMTELPMPVQVIKNTRVLPQILPDHRQHKPQTKSCGFLDKNVMFLNEPICNVYTAPVQHKEGQWWPSRANPGELVIPPYAEDTHYRNDYNYRHGERPYGSGRHTSNVNREPALGTIPVNYLREKDGSQRLYKEGMSYEHMYDSRADPSYPIRGKRHGAFVWSRMDPLSQKKFVEYYQRLEEQEKSCPSPSLLEKVQSPVVVRSRNNSNVSNASSKCQSSSSSVRSLSSQKPELAVAAAPSEPPVAEEKPAPVEISPQLEMKEVQQESTTESAAQSSCAETNTVV